MIKISRFKFSMRTMLIVILLAAFLSAMIAAWVNYDREFLMQVDRINAIGGVPARSVNGELISVDFYNTIVGDRVGKLKDEDLKYIASINTIRLLSLAGTNVTDKGIAYLEEMTELDRVNLERTDVTEAGIEKLKLALPNCEIVWGK